MSPGSSVPVSRAPRARDYSALGEGLPSFSVRTFAGAETRHATSTTENPMKDLTESETLALADLLYLVTHSDELNATVLANYGAAVAGKSGMPAPRDFAAILETLYVKSCK